MGGGGITVCECNDQVTFTIKLMFLLVMNSACTCHFLFLYNTAVLVMTIVKS